MTTSMDLQVQFMVRFMQPQRLLPPLPGVQPALEAQLLGLSGEQFDAVLCQLAEDRNRAAEVLLGDPEIVAAIDRLPFSANDTVVGVGDSLTADRCGWFDILATAVNARRVKDCLRFVNAGVSGDSSIQMLARLPALLSQRPRWVLALAGGNDARRFGDAESPVQLSVEATVRTLKTMRALALKSNVSNWLWITPPGISQVAAAQSPLWQAFATHWRAQDIADIASAVASLEGPVCDLRDAFAGSLLDGLLLDDGIHPNVEGQTLIARAVIRRLTTPE